eukprot:2303046-Rhodomonas_salina.1
MQYTEQCTLYPKTTDDDDCLSRPKSPRTFNEALQGRSLQNLRHTTPDPDMSGNTSAETNATTDGKSVVEQAGTAANGALASAGNAASDLKQGTVNMFAGKDEKEEESMLDQTGRVAKQTLDQ